jgi:AcrR family transcriptional regulator
VGAAGGERRQLEPGLVACGIRPYTPVVTRLDESTVLGAGVTVVRARGVDALGVRAVAEHLGVTPMALYRYVADGDALRASVLEQIQRGLPIPVGEGSADDRFRAWAIATRTMLSRYPGLAHHLLLHWFESAATIDVVESLLAVARDAGLDGFACVAAANAVFMYVLMRVDAEMAVRTARVVTRKLRPVADDPARYPLAHAYASEFTTARLTDHFAYGLDALLTGISAARVATGSAR